MTSPEQTPNTQAVRLIFEYEGESVTLVAQQPVDTVVSGFDAHPDVRPGHFVEARDEDGHGLARVAARGAFQESAEVFPEDHSEPITRVDVAARGAFTVLLPAPPEATEVAVVRVDRAGSGAQPFGGATSPPPGAVSDVDLATFRLQR